MEKLTLTFLLAYLVNSEKRIVLHSSTDMAQELLKLKSEFEAFKTNVSSKISSLEKENAALQNKLKSKTGMTFFYILYPAFYFYSSVQKTTAWESVSTSVRHTTCLINP